ncbi:MAG: tetratricopeptide repeat protein [Rhodospirillaceae bacterium]|nr:MAG: tetratricopeptide repeat protein [Rhodospirillaceae bacterium]
MKKATAIKVVALSLVLAAGGAGPGTQFGVHVAAAADKQVSVKLGPPLKEANALQAQKNYKGSLAKLEEADAIPGKTPYESFVIAQLKYNAYAGLQNWSEAAKTVEAILASGQSPDNQLPIRLKQLMQAYGQLGNSAKLVEIGNRYLKDVGADPDIQMLLAQTYTNQRNYKQAEDMVRSTMKAAEARGVAPKEEWLATLRFVAHEQGNTAGEQTALEMLVQRYPTQKYWEDLLLMVDKNLKGGDETSLDVARLRLATGLLKTDAEYMDMAQDALQQNLPDEAMKVVQIGIQKGVLGQGPQKARHQRLLDMAKKQAGDELSGLDARDAAVKAASVGDDDVKLGEVYWSKGQNDKAVEAIQRGLKKGVTDKDNAELRLGLALMAAGKKGQADTAFRAIKPNTNAAAIARLWTLYASTHSS